MVYSKKHPDQHKSHQKTKKHQKKLCLKQIKLIKLKRTKKAPKTNQTPTKAPTQKKRKPELLERTEIELHWLATGVLGFRLPRVSKASSWIYKCVSKGFQLAGFLLFRHVFSRWRLASHEPFPKSPEENPSAFMLRVHLPSGMASLDRSKHETLESSFGVLGSSSLATGFCKPETA